MNQAKLENQIIYWHQQECRNSSDMDCSMCLSTSGISQIRVRFNQKYAAVITPIAAQFIRETRLDGFAAM
jgi:hypothetical protein